MGLGPDKCLSLEGIIVKQRYLTVYYDCIIHSMGVLFCLARAGESDAHG
jgi:hypothetical protein